MALFKICRGKEANLPSTLTNGYAYFCTDTSNFYIDHLNASDTLVRSKISANYADKLRYVKDGSTIDIDPSTILTDSNYETKIGTVTTSKNGLMSKADKIKLDGIPEGTSIEINTNKVTSLSVSSTDTQYPSAKAAYTLATNSKTIIVKVTAGSTITADKTFSVISSAMNNGRIVAALYMNCVMLPVAFYDSSTSEISFAAVQPASGYTTLKKLKCTSENVWSYSEYKLEHRDNLVTSISADSTNTQYPSAKTVYNAINNVKTYVDNDSRIAKHLLFDSDDNLTGVKIKDQVNGYNYILCMRNGTLASTCATSTIAVTTNPTKMSYVAGEYIDTTGMVISATCEDGTLREITDYTCDNYVTIDNPIFTITYTEGGVTYSTTLAVTVTTFDPATILVDFDYTDNGDGTYTITDWKETYNGEASTEMIVPNNAYIIL